MPSSSLKMVTSTAYFQWCVALPTSLVPFVEIHTTAPGTGSCSRKHSYSTVSSRALDRKPNLFLLKANRSGSRPWRTAVWLCLVLTWRPPCQARHLSNGWIVPSSPSSSIHIVSSLHDRMTDTHIVSFSDGPFGGRPHFPSYSGRERVP